MGKTAMNAGVERITALGTGNASARQYYNTCFILRGGCGGPVLVDGGGGNRIFDQLDAADVPLADIHDAVLTHAHTDHLFGMLWVLRGVATLMKLGRYEGSFTLYCHAALAKFVTDFVKMSFDAGMGAFLGNTLRIASVRDGEARVVAGREMTFFDIRSSKLRQYGFALRLAGGGRLVFAGDEPLAPALHDLARNADWLLTEAFCLASESGIFHPYEKHHSTVTDACLLAEKLSVANLVLWHTEDSHGPQRKHVYRAEGRRYFSGNLYVPDDMETIPLSSNAADGRRGKSAGSACSAG